VNATQPRAGTVVFDAPTNDLSTFATTPQQRRAAAVIAAAIIVMTLAAAPFADVRLPLSTTFIIAQATASGLLMLIAGYILFRQAAGSNSLPLMWIALAYLASGVLQTGYLGTASDTLPGLAMVVGRQASFFYGLAVDIVFPACILVGFWCSRRTWYLGATAKRRGMMLRTAAFGMVAFVAALLAYGIALRFGPNVFAPDAHGPTPVSLVGNAAGLLLLVIATAVMWRAGRGLTVTNLWVTISLVSLLAGTFLFLESPGRYSLVWYVAKIEGILGPAAMVIATVYEGGRMHAAVERAQRGLRSLVDGMTDALLVVDVGGRVVQANPAAVTLFGYTTAEFTELDLDMLVPNANALPRGSRRIEMRARRQSGELFPVEIAVGESARDETSSRTVTVRDITQRIRAEAATRLARDRALEATKLKSQFLATMSHEIRTPINAVIGMSELLLEGELIAEQREYAQTVRDSANALLAIINDILDFSKLEAGKMSLDAYSFSPVVSVEGAAEILAGEARRKGLSLVTYIAPEVPENLLGDANRLRQILLNLIGNAIKFTHEGGIVVHARIARETESDVVLHISVADTGIGLSEATRQRLFEAFVQADGSTSRQFGGTGLGLSISRRLVDMMGGEIGVESVEGMGATFWFTVPFARGEADTATGMDRPLYLPPMRCLAIDDDPDARAIVERYLHTWGLQCDEAEDAAQGLAMLERAAAAGTPYDVALCDLKLPDRDGIELARAIRSQPELDHTRFILVTAYDEPGRGADAIANGYAAYLRKPFRRAALYEALLAVNRGAAPVVPEELPANAFGVAPVVQGPTTASDGQSLRILLVEDHPVNRKLVFKQLEKLGYVGVDSVNDGAEAIDATARTRYDLVLMDCQMPVVDGFTATRRIRSREETTGEHVPIVALTANALEGDREACLAAGMDAYLSKPVQLADLRSTIAAYALTAARAG
jgi:PAS domain S-box-containing protein